MSASHQALRKDEVIWLRADGRTVEARVLLASPAAPQSIAVAFEAVLGGWAGGMPLLQEADGRWRALDGLPVVIERRLGSPPDGGRSPES